MRITPQEDKYKLTAKGDKRSRCCPLVLPDFVTWHGAESCDKKEYIVCCNYRCSLFPDLIYSIFREPVFIFPRHESIK